MDQQTQESSQEQITASENISPIKKKKKKSSSEIASETLSPEDIYRIVRPRYLFIE